MCLNENHQNHHQICQLYYRGGIIGQCRLGPESWRHSNGLVKFGIGGWGSIADYDGITTTELTHLFVVFSVTHTMDGGHSRPKPKKKKNRGAKMKGVVVVIGFRLVQTQTGSWVLAN